MTGAQKKDLNTPHPELLTSEFNIFPLDRLDAAGETDWSKILLASIPLWSLK